MTTEHDSDKYREMRQRINQTNSQAGLPAVLDWSVEDQVLKDLNRFRFPQTTNHDMRRWAAGIVEEHLRWVDPYDDSPAGPCVLFGFDTRIRFSLAEHSVEDLAATYLPDHYATCNVNAVIECEKTNARAVLTVVFGEWVCLGKCCGNCWDWFHDQDPNYKYHEAVMDFPPNGDPLSDRHPAT